MTVTLRVIITSNQYPCVQWCWKKSSSHCAFPRNFIRDSNHLVFHFFLTPWHGWLSVERPGGRGGERYFQKSWSEGVRPTSQNPYLIKHQNTRFLLAYLWPGQKFDILFTTVLWRAYVDSLDANDEKVSSSRKHTQLQATVLKPYPIYNQNGQHRYHIYDQKGWKTYHLGRHIPIQR